MPAEVLESRKQRVPASAYLSPENTKVINKEILKLIGIIKAQLDYFKQK